SPYVLSLLIGGIVVLGLFIVVEARSAAPMIQLGLFKIRAFVAGNVAGLVTAVARGGLQFMLIIWLQGIWLPLHGYPYSDTPLWAGIFMLPLTFGFLIAGPISGRLSDRFGARGFATVGACVFGLSFLGLIALPVDFPYPAFAFFIFANGVGSGMFASPNTASIMSSVPAAQRGAAAGMRATFQNSGTALSVGVFFSLLIAGLASSLPRTLTEGLERQGVSPAVAQHLGSLPPVSSLFAALLGVNPLRHLLVENHALSALSPNAQALVTGKEFFPDLISQPFHDGLVVVFATAAVFAGLAGVASLLRGPRGVPERAASAVTRAPGADRHRGAER
ncbi:MAG: MFS transporter, partial [Candidatus Dormibacteraeota bacterium]|nr:MFS transporter [Candidatus Dormibacteraeota bacterium]